MFDSQRRSPGPAPNAGRLAPLLRHLPALGLWAGAGIAVVIAVLSLVPVEISHSAPLIGLDKLYHLVAYAALVFPVVVTGPRRWLWAVPAAIVFGGVIELIQPHVGREGEWADAVANALGAGLGAWAGTALHRVLVRRFGVARG